MFSFKKKEKLNAPLNVPKHIAVIMDGNGRWAKKSCYYGRQRPLGQKKDAAARVRS